MGSRGFLGVSAMTLFAQPHRAPWDDFPDVVIIVSESAVKQHPDYEQAKQGNVQDAAPAAKRLASALLTRPKFH